MNAKQSTEAVILGLLESMDPAQQTNLINQVRSLRGGLRFETPEIRLARKSKRQMATIRVDLQDMKPPVWRRLKLATDLDLSQLHIILQTAMGWKLEHLHSFQAWDPETRQYVYQSFLSRYDVEEEGGEGVAEYDVQIGQVLHNVGDKLMYWYDFGDDWRHKILLEKVEPWVADSPLAICVGGRKACPPEDCGGPWGFEEVKAILASNPRDDDSDQKSLRQWLDDMGYDNPDHFSIEETNEALAEEEASGFDETAYLM